jgi:hypothetical protein
MARVPRTAGAIAGVAAALAFAVAHADDFDDASVIFARGSSLYQVDARGKGEIEIAQLGGKTSVRALRTDADGTVLLADLDGKWAWMPLDRSTRTLSELPCGDGPAQLAEDGTSVLCRSPRAANQSILVELAPTAPGKPPREPRRAPLAIDVPPGARLAGAGAEARLFWADAGGVWVAPPSDPKKRMRIAPEAPRRSFLPSPDGTRAIGVFADQVFSDVRHTRSAEVLMTLQLDNRGARRKTIRDGVPVEWSHDSEWLLVQDGASACIMRVAGGQYKCWRGYTAASLSGDGRWALALGNRDGSKKQAPAKRAKPAARSARPAAPTKPEPAKPAPARGDKPWDILDEPTNEPETGEPPPAYDDVAVAPPSGPLSLFRLRLEGAFTDRPTLLVKVVDGAAVWVPKAR